MAKNVKLLHLAQRLEKVALHLVANTKRRNTKVLYHIGKRPAAPHPSTRFTHVHPEKGNRVFLTPNWLLVWTKHDIRGNIYKYQIPIAAIREAGGIVSMEGAREAVFTKEIWEKYNLGNALVRKVMDMADAAKYVYHTIMMKKDIDLLPEQNKRDYEELRATLPERIPEGWEDYSQENVDIKNRDLRKRIDRRPMWVPVKR